MLPFETKYVAALEGTMAVGRWWQPLHARTPEQALEQGRLAFEGVRLLWPKVWRIEVFEVLPPKKAGKKPEYKLIGLYKPVEAAAEFVSAAIGW